MKLKNNSERPMFLEYQTPSGRKPRYCCYKDDPCDTHAAVLKNLARMAKGEIEADPKNLQVGLVGDFPPRI